MYLLTYLLTKITVKSAEITADFLNNREIHGKFTALIHGHTVFKNIALARALLSVNNHRLEN